MARLALGDALVLSPPGLASIVAREAQSLNLRVVHSSHDRRADVVGLSRPGDGVKRLRTAEDILLVAGTLTLGRTAAATARGLDRSRVVAALQVGSGARGRGPRHGVRVVVRLADERNFVRTALRAAVERELGPLFDGADDADELWVIQTDTRTLHVAVRVKAWSRRSRSRIVERQGALRPAIAAAMVLSAGEVSRVLDPCCGAGTILAEAAAAASYVVGGDLAHTAVTAARANTTSTILQLDARRLPFGNDSFDAVITNLPFGTQHQVQGSPVAWYRRVLAESMRVAPVSVVLMPPTRPFRQALGRLRADLLSRTDINVLGRDAAIWTLRPR